MSENLDLHLKKNLLHSINWSFWFTLASQFFQLTLLWYIVFSLQIEKSLLLERFLPLVIGFWGIHSVVAIRFRPIVFFIGFACTLFLFLGFGDALTLFTMGLAMLGICHLPTSITIRRLIVLGIGIYLAFARIGILWSPLSTHGLTIFAAIFMFRVILYLYELKFEKTPTSIWHRLNYFFMMPNIVFPLFPIVDYKTYLNTYYDKSETFIYQRGISLIIWSVICLITYRLLYYFAVPDLTTITGVEQVTQYIIATYLTVIRLVGILSLSVGVLRLFGYNLPDIFNYMFLASSFSDLFRRINIYWKSFLMKLCYYPTYFKLRKITPKHALLLSALVTFFFTWFFHIYQWAWILGSNPIRWTSILYWGIFGSLATMSMLLENKKAKPAVSFAGCLLHATKVAGVFLTIAILYSMWTNATFEDWYAVIHVAFLDDLGSWLKVFGGILLSIFILGLGVYLYRNNSSLFKWKESNPTLSYLSLAIMFIVLTSFVKDSHNETVIKFAQGEELNSNDAATEYEGYYEDILKVDISSQLWDDQINSFLISKNWKDLFVVRLLLDSWKEANAMVSEEIPVGPEFSFSQQSFVVPRNDIMISQLLPNQTSTFRKKRFSTNQWGLRDKNYEKTPPPNTVRIALLGGSPSLGFGVHDEEVYEAITEKKLNETFGTDSLQFEILNFSLGHVFTFQYAYLLEEDVMAFQPDYIILVDHFSKEQKLFNALKRAFESKVTIYPELKEVLDAQGIDENSVETPEKIVSTGSFIKEWALFRFASICKKNDIDPILLYFPSLSSPGEFRKYRQTAMQAGYEIFDLQNIFTRHLNSNLHVSRTDKHPNPMAHQIIADNLYEKLVDYLDLQ